MYNRKLNITETERNKIRKMYSLNTKEDYIFDFVLSENNKYLIIMDQVFVEGGNGKTIGTIWDHTDIFNEIIKESFQSLGKLNESVNDIINNIQWNKELIKEWINEKPVIVEGWFDNLTSAAGDMVKTVFTQGVIPFLRWVRRGLYTGVGIVIDVVVSILAVKTNAIVWLVICVLDLYEIITNDYDPKEPERQQMPFLLLIGDLLGAVFSGGVGLLFKKAAPMVAKQGVKVLAPTMGKYLEMLLKKIPSLKGSLSSTVKLLGTKMGPKASGFVSKVISGIDNILTSLEGFLSKLFSGAGATAVATGGVVLGSTHLMGKAMSNSQFGQKLGSGMLAAEKGIQDKFNMKVNPSSNEDVEINKWLNIT